MFICSYCGNEASEEKRLSGCCGEMHFDEVEVCPNCGEGIGEEVHYRPDPSTGDMDCDYLRCDACGHQWNHS